ncbi:RecX family transcriptional regulator [Candidatus Saccharibacteria bacterium]|nr:RecX family transcriptional regulator [Candidatus Saccharibacteria bacterium]
MKIYKISDEILDEQPKKEQKNGELKENSDLVITNLKQGVRNSERVNVFVNDEYSFSLNIKQVVDFGIKVGKNISEDELTELKRASEFGKLYQRALEWALMRPRSKKELQDYLYRKLKMPSSGRSSRPSSRGSSLRPRSNCGCPSEDIFKFSQTIVEKLISKGYVDDKKFAEWYVENRFIKKGVSQKRLRMELIKKGISKEIIDEVLSNRNDEEEIKKVIAKKRDKYDDEKLINYLVRQGFSYQLAQNLVRGYEKD